MIDGADQNVIGYLSNLIRRKHNESVDQDYFETELNKLYTKFAFILLEHYESILTRKQFLKYKMLCDDQDMSRAIELVFKCVPDSEQRIKQIIDEFTESYFNDTLDY